MARLTKLQQTLLQSAAGNPAGHITRPEGDKAQAAIAGLIRHGLAMSVPNRRGGSKLMITEGGRTEVGAPADAPPASPTLAEGGSPAPSAEPSGKIAILIGLLRRPEGAGIPELSAATGWQAHSVRGAISGAVKKRLGLTVSSTASEAGRVYRIDNEAAA
jgi:hypothetical protein